MSDAKLLRTCLQTSGAGLPLATRRPTTGVPARGVPCSLVKVMNGWSAAKR